MIPELLVDEPRINHEAAIEDFRRLLDATAPHRVLRLLGNGKMGKTFLLTRIFPRLIAAQRLRYAHIDMHNPAHGPLDLLHTACGQLDRRRFATFDAAYESWLNRPRIAVSGLQVLLARVSVSSRADADESARAVPLLTRKFVDDLEGLNATPLVLLFDAVDNAAPAIQSWLMASLLVQLSALPHVRVVVAGRTLPDAAGAYAARCVSHELRPVTEAEAYIAYCQAKGLRLGEQSIRDFARAAGYAPGQFADLVKVFAPLGAGHD
jgi:hypothetical protein